MNARSHLTLNITASGAEWRLGASSDPPGEGHAVPRREAERVVADWLRGGGGATWLQLRNLALLLRRHTLRELPDATTACAILCHELRTGALGLTRHEARRPVHAPPRGKEPPPTQALPPESRAETDAWIEVRLVDEVGEPVPGARYRIKLPDGSVREGSLNAHGLVHLRGIDPGTCEFTFPELDTDAWARLS